MHVGPSIHTPNRLPQILTVLWALEDKTELGSGEGGIEYSFHLLGKGYIIVNRGINCRAVSYCNH